MTEIGKPLRTIIVEPEKPALPAADPKRISEPIRRLVPEPVRPIKVRR